MNTKLVIVEGLPGSGKTTMAAAVAEWLEARGRVARLHLEGDLDHPADPESVACFDGAGWDDLLGAFPEWQTALDARVGKAGGDRMIGYRKLRGEFGARLPDALYDRLAAMEVYELPPDRYRAVVLRSWTAFVDAHLAEDAVYVFECCFLQNALTMLFGRHDEPPRVAESHIRRLADAIRPLDPLLIYLDPGRPADVLARVVETRPREWLDFVIRYHTEQGHGRAVGWHGMEGLIRFYEMRRAFELDVLDRLPFSCIAVAHSTWDEDRRRVEAALEAAFVEWHGEAIRAG